VKRTPYDSDISAQKFAEIEPLLRSVRRSTKPGQIDLYEVFCAVLYLLRTVYQWRYLPPQCPKWQSVYAYWRKWSEPDQHGVSVLERALKKSGWRGPRETGAQRMQRVLDHRRAEREEHGHDGPEGLRCGHQATHCGEHPGAATRHRRDHGRGDRPQGGAAGTAALQALQHCSTANLP
jgi:transposase